MVLSVTLALLASLLLDVLPVNAQEGVVVDLRASTQVAGNVGEAPRTGDCDVHDGTLNGVSSGSLSFSNDCNVENFGQFTARATASAATGGNTASAFAQFAASGPAVDFGHSIFYGRSAASGYANVAISDTITVTTGGFFQTRIIFNTSASVSDCAVAAAGASGQGFVGRYEFRSSASSCSGAASVHVDERADPIYYEAGQQISVGYAVFTTASGGTSDGYTNASGIADASHTLWVILEALTPGASYTSARGVDYSASPEGSSQFRFKLSGFSEPITMGITNLAQAGRTVPVIWRLTDLAGAPVTDPQSFAGVFSVQTACDSTTESDPLEAYSAGDSTLQYLGNGYWQFNWKTQKSFAKTCRRMYLELGDGQISDQVKFSFR